MPDFPPYQKTVDFVPNVETTALGLSKAPKRSIPVNIALKSIEKPLYAGIAIGDTKYLDLVNHPNE